MNHEEALAFAERWVKNWNDHDIEAVLAISPTTSFSPRRSRAGYSRNQRRGHPREGRAAPATGRGRAARPGLRFELLGVYAGAGTVVIRFRTEQGADRCEVLTFGGGLVRTGHGTYLAASG